MANKPTETLTPEQLLENLQRFTGSEQFIQHPLSRSVVYTEGVHYLAEEAGAFWLIDAIASYFGSPEMRAAIAQDERLESLQFWNLKLTDPGAVLTAQADKGETPFITQEIPFTDFPLRGIDIWAGFNGAGWTLYLPSEH
mgnify:CR=1 FL=1